FGRSDAGKGQRTMVEFVSANPTGPMHVGHGRGAVIGDTVANLLEWAGYQVSREFYINDAGGQVFRLAHAVLARATELTHGAPRAAGPGRLPGRVRPRRGARLATDLAKSQAGLADAVRRAARALARLRDRLGPRQFGQAGSGAVPHPIR